MRTTGNNGTTTITDKCTGGGLGLISWIFLGGAVLLMFFVILSGVTGSTPLDKIYFLYADLSNVQGVGRVVQWTYFYICGEGNQQCNGAHPALPFGFAWLNADQAEIPGVLTGSYGSGTTSHYYFYVWRFGWVFYLMALFFACMALLSGLLSFTRIGSGFSSLLALAATFFQTLAAVLMT